VSPWSPELCIQCQVLCCFPELDIVLVAEAFRWAAEEAGPAEVLAFHAVVHTVLAAVAFVAAVHIAQVDPAASEAVVEDKEYFPVA